MSEQMTMKNGTSFTIAPCSKEQWDDAIRLVFKVFLKYESKQYGREGTDKFAEFLTNPLLKMLFESGKYIVYVATINNEIIGVCSLRSGNHISLLFVDEEHHRQGIATLLIKTLQDYLLRNTDYDTITVNAAPFGIPFYEKMGFKATGDETVQDGVIYTPMEMFL